MFAAAVLLGHLCGYCVRSGPLAALQSTRFVAVRLQIYADNLSTFGRAASVREHCCSYIIIVA